jgi:FAD/FMN-containing dehydrogenase
MKKGESRVSFDFNKFGFFYAFFKYLYTNCICFCAAERIRGKWARENNVPIRIRSGRHALAKDLSQTNGGIVIDTCQIRKVILNKTKGIATVQAGMRVGPLVKMLAQEGILAPFGDSSTVGVGGITVRREYSLVPKQNWKN